MEKPNGFSKKSKKIGTENEATNLGRRAAAARRGGGGGAARRGWGARVWEVPGWAPRLINPDGPSVRVGHDPLGQLRLKKTVTLRKKQKEY